jgi:hypothetical protein
LRQRQIRRALVEVDLCSLLHPVGAVPEVDRVQVGGENPVLRPATLELPGERSLFELARDRPLPVDNGVLDQLLRDRGATLDDVLVSDVGPDRPQDAAEVDAAVLPESAIFDRHDGLLHHRRDLRRLDGHPRLGAAEHGEDRLSV